MSKRSLGALFVPDLTVGIAFYVGQLKFKLGDHHPLEDVAQIMLSDGKSLLLAGPKAGDLTSYLVEQPFQVKAGDVLPFPTTDLDTLCTELRQNYDEHVQVVEARWGDRWLDVRDPGNYILRFITRASYSAHEWLEFYSAGAEELEAAVAGLSEADLELSLRPDSWSIRHIIHHLADTETGLIWWMKLALADSGRTHTPDRWASSGIVNETLAASFQPSKREIAPSLVLVRAIRTHIAQLIPYVSDAWGCYTLNEQGNKTTFGELVVLVTRHALEHIDEVVETRRVHGR